MADLTPEERAGLRQCGEDDYGVPYFRLDADRLAELVRRYDEAVALLRLSPPISRSVRPIPHARSLCDCDGCAFLAALEEVPK